MSTRALLRSADDGGLGHLAEMWQHVVLAGASVLLICRTAAGGRQACRTGGARPFPRVPVIRHDSQQTCRWRLSEIVHLNDYCIALSGGLGGERNRKAWRQAAWARTFISSPENHADSPAYASRMPASCMLICWLAPSHQGTLWLHCLTSQSGSVDLATVACSHL